MSTSISKKKEKPVEIQKQIEVAAKAINLSIRVVSQDVECVDRHTYRAPHFLMHSC